MAGRNVIAPEGLSFAVLRDAIEQVSDVDIVELRERRVQERGSPFEEKEGLPT